MSSAPDIRSVHVMVPPAVADKLRLLSSLTRVVQGEYLREAARSVLETYGAVVAPVFPRERTNADPMVSVVFRMRVDQLDALHELAERTRVKQSEYLRIGIKSVLEKYSAVLETATPSEAWGSP